MSEPKMPQETGGSQKKRRSDPLKPNRMVLLVSGATVTKLSPSKITKPKVGQKAFGLASIPEIWTVPFVVVKGQSSPSVEAIENALNAAGLKGQSNMIVRSSGVNESIDSRGVNDSLTCSRDKIVETISVLERERISNSAAGVVHWIIQESIHTVAKGHLSNERRISKVDRDWLAEIERSKGQAQESHPIAIRTWRDARIPEPGKIVCAFKENYVDGLETVARWAYARKLRVHFEWVWDGVHIYIVQADQSELEGVGVNPESVVAIPPHHDDLAVLQAFRSPIPEDYSRLPKLKNTNIYKRVGYDMNNFYILPKEDALSSLLTNEVVTEALSEDLRALTQRPLILRTDGSDIPSDQRTMLPRSDELRSEQAAVEWLLGEFVPTIRKLGLQNCSLSLIAHNFIPALSSAWCKADPDLRRVRIESLWGIPEGLYWYAHDVFDVDTRSLSVPQQDSCPDFTVHERTRYKSQFIAPDENGNWVVHKTAAGPDWSSSIPKQKWVREIAWATRRVAEEEGTPVVVMWFIGIPASIQSGQVLPWYHEVPDNSEFKAKAAPRKKSPNEKEFCISTREDWTRLRRLVDDGERVSRVTVNPKEPDLVRDRDFVQRLGSLAKKEDFVVELNGGILSHAYYLLTAEGCSVECADLFAADNEELEFNKLVRDKIPDMISTHGEQVDAVELKGEALVESLKRKVVEEAFEVYESKNTGELTSEIADLLEVIGAIQNVLTIEDEAIDRVKHAKVEKRGGFEKGLMLKKTALGSSVTKENDEKNLEFVFSNAEDLQVLKDVSDLPRSSERSNFDVRHSESGELEQQTTFSVPMYGQALGQVHLGEVGSEANEVLIDGQMERDGANIKFKIRLTTAPKQIELEL